MVGSVDTALRREGDQVLQEQVAVREALADEEREEQEMPGGRVVELRGGLRAQLVADQWGDTALAVTGHAARRQRVKAPDAPLERDGRAWRVAPDNAIEVAVCAPGEGRSHWVPVVPERGSPGGGQSWKAVLFCLVHVGPLGGHRAADKTAQLLSRLC